MKRTGNLFETICSLENLILAERRAKKGKRARSEVSDFRLNLESNLLSLSEELHAGRYQGGDFKVFAVRDPKMRLIAAPSYRDRIVHHAICGVIEPIFDRIFIDDSYACRRNKGAHAAMDRLSQWLHKDDYVFQGDLSLFFPSIDHLVLQDLIARRIKCKRTLELISTTIAAGDHVSKTPGKGLPIGSLTSQLFANLYLHELDTFAKHGLQFGRYLRYCDDFLFIGSSKANLAVVRDAVDAMLVTALHLDLHPTKRQVYPAHLGVPFLGFRHFPGAARRLLPANGRRFARRLRALDSRVRNGQSTPELANIRVQSWRAHAAHGHTEDLQRAMLSGAPSEWVLG